MGSCCILKYLSDLWKDKQRELHDKYKGDKERIKRALTRERFVVPDECDFDYLYAQRDAPNIGELINIALERIEDANKAKLENVFRNIDFNCEPALGQTKERNRRLKHLLEDFNDARLDLRPSRVGHRDVIGDVYEYLIGQFAAGAGKKAGEFYTPPEVSTLLAKLVQPKPGDRICDPACGSGSLLIRVAKEVKDDDGKPTELLALRPGIERQHLGALPDEHVPARAGRRPHRVVRHDHQSQAGRRRRADEVRRRRRQSAVLARQVGRRLRRARPHQRFWRGIPPKSKGDYAFITHMIEIALEGDGRIGVIVPHGVLFRGGSEGLIRQKLIEENLLEAVIGLPANLFFGTGIPAAILIFDKGRKTTDVLFIDASREFEDDKNQNRLRPEDIEKIVGTYRTFKSVPKYAYRATRKEIEENEFNLNIPRYVDTFEEEAEIDIAAVQTEIEGLERSLPETRKEMKRFLKELGYEA